MDSFVGKVFKIIKTFHKLVRIKNPKLEKMFKSYMLALDHEKIQSIIIIYFIQRMAVSDKSYRSYNE